MSINRLKRREFIRLLGGAAAAWPRTASAQETAKPPLIGFLGVNNLSAQRPFNAAFEQRLHELGWIVGRTIKIEYRWAEGRAERYAEIADEFVRLNVDVIVTGGSGAYAVKKATSVIPVIFVAAQDPVANGIVTSLAHPGGNTTGLSTQQTDTAGKRLEFLHEVVPGLRRLAVIANIGNAGPRLELAQVRTAALRFGLDVIPLEIRTEADILPSLEQSKDHADGLYVCGDPLITSNRVRINTLALAARLPTIFNFREDVEAGALISYGPDFPDLYRRAAEYLDKILRGTKPADLPVEQPTKFDLAFNLTTARAFGLTVPTALLALADKIVE